MNIDLKPQLLDGSEILQIGCESNPVRFFKQWLQFSYSPEQGQIL